MLGIDIGGSRAASAIVVVIRDLRVAAVHVYEGDEAVLTVSEKGYSSWPGTSTSRRPHTTPGGGARRPYAPSRGVSGWSVELPQSHARHDCGLGRAPRPWSRSAYGIPETVPSTATLAADVARVTGRGWRLDRSAHDTQIDAVVAVAMAVERAEHREPAARLLGWI